MLILSRTRVSRSHPGYDRKTSDATKRVLERGLARVALAQKREGRGLDAYGAPLAHASDVERAHSAGGLERLSRRTTGMTVVQL